MLTRPPKEDEAWLESRLMHNNEQSKQSNLEVNNLRVTCVINYITVIGFGQLVP